MNDAGDKDDDLPVLTQVLRIGGIRADALSIAEPGQAPGDRAASGATESPLDEILLTDQLVIGNEPHEGLEPYVPLTTAKVEPAERSAEPLAQAMEASTAQSLIVPFIAPVDLPASAPAPFVQGATHDVSDGAAETGHEKRDAANDAEDAKLADRALQEAAAAVGPEVTPTEERVDVPASAVIDHDAFAMRVRESVLNDLSARIDTEFDARIAQTLRAEVEAALANLHANLREQLADAMRDVVRRAVEEEVARISHTPTGETPRE
ncbi:MAG: hypothetical protein ACR2GP_14895 [Burkholderiaceae bacterium]